MDARRRLKSGLSSSAPRVPWKVRLPGTDAGVLTDLGVRRKTDVGGTRGILWGILGSILWGILCPRRPRPTYASTKRTARAARQ
jgi:hypothetical protein